MTAEEYEKTLDDDPETRSTFRAALDYLNSEPELLSLLYDLDLMPEQNQTAQDWNKMLLIVLFCQIRLKGKSDVSTPEQSIQHLTNGG